MSDFLRAARHTDQRHPSPHQIAAWTWAWSLLSHDQQAEFLELFRAAPDDKVADVPNTWAGVVTAAKQSGARYPELVAAQWALESGWGKHVTGTHNYFGQKGPGTVVQTQEVVNGKAITINAEFLNFQSLRESVQYLVDRWHLDWKDAAGTRYRGVNHAPSRDAAAQMLVAEGYATDPRYAEKLIELMRHHAPIANASVSPQGFGNPLAVPWFAQLDSATDQGRRMCFSSSCAMLLAYLKPGALAGSNGDDQYLSRVQQFGDTTDAAAQLKALQSYGIRARFVQNADFKLIERQIDRGVPVPCGYLHRGPVSAPAGGGHWLTVVGYAADHLVVHDPLGESDLVSGTTLKAAARFARYSRKNFGPRWMVEGPGTGWAIVAER